MHFGTLFEKNYNFGLISKCDPFCAWIFFRWVFPWMNFFFGHFALHEFFFGFFPIPPITFLMVRPLDSLVHEKLLWLRLFWSKQELQTQELNRKVCRKISSPLSMQTLAASFNNLENSFDALSSSCQVSVTIFILFISHAACCLANPGRLVK